MARVAFALDFASVEQARAAAAEVAPAVGMLKVGLELFVHAGPAVVAMARDLGLPVFLDLKLHDIPETVERAVAQASKLGASVITVHASGGRTMLERAVERAAQEGGTLSICAVTILTSLDDRDLDEIGLAAEGDGSKTRASAERLARLAYDAGVRWFVSSPAEVASLRQSLGPDAVLVTPGVRLSSSKADDQKRVATPEQAVKDGADWLVVGRPIRDAAHRLEAAKAIAAAAASASKEKP